MTGTILIVDDSLTVRMDLVEAFENAGFYPVPCASVAEARAALITRAPIGAVVLDVMLPDGDGVELAAEIRKADPASTIAILMLSSEAEVKDRVRALQTGADEYVGKPYDRGYVVAKARELVRARRASPAQRATTVLLVDDSVTFRESLREALEAAGYSVLAAPTGEEGLRTAADRRPDAIIVDGVLPGIDGPTVIRRIRLDAALRGTPCILLTASDDRGAELRALDAGADAFVRKEDDLGVILARLAASLRGGPLPDRDQTASLLGPHRILAVDDSPTYLNEVTATLRADGYDVVPARSGEEALELLAVQSVDCILLDLLMPGLGGKETCRQIKSAPIVRDIPLIILTGLDDRASMLEGLGAGADDYIPKSSELDVLRARVRAQIRRKQFEDETRTIRERLIRTEFEATEARAARQLAEARAALADELELKNQELEAFSYSVSHDLRAPLRSIDGFARALAEDYGEKLDDQAREHLRRVRGSAQRMAQMIEDLLLLSRASRGELRKQRVDLGALAREIAAQLVEREPQRRLELDVADPLIVDADPGLIRTVLENLLGNAWKFTAPRDIAKIELGTSSSDTGRVYFVRDNGVGFDATYAEKLFKPFQRLHEASEFEGTGIGLATVHRIITRHGGRVWAEGAEDRGATVFFTLR
jgi:two-component system, NtrC family, sensor kinase